MWYMWSSTGSDRSLEGIWTYEGGNWHSMGTLDAQMIPILDVGQQTVGQLNFDRISGFAAQVQHLAIGNAENLFPEYWHGEEALGEYVYHTNHNLDSTSQSRFFSENPPVPSLWSAHVLNNRRGWQIAGAGGSQSIAFRMGPGRGIRVTPGERYAIQSLVRDFGGSSFLGWVIHFISLDGSQGTSGLDRIDLDISGRVHGPSDTNGDTDTFQVPDLGWGPMDMIITLRHTGSSYSGSGQRTVMEPKLRKMMEGTLVVDGTITSSKVAAEAILAEHIYASSSLSAKVGEFLTIRSGNIESNAVTADKISFGSLNGSLITGLQIQTHTNNHGVKLTSAGIRAFDSSGSETFNVNASNGSVTADGGTFTGGVFQTSSNWASAGGVNISADSRGHFRSINSAGQVTARLGGDRNELRDLSVGSLSVDGELRVGGNGEGGIIPDGDRTRFVGRTPLTSSSEDTVAYGRTSAARFDPSQGANIYAITYETPTSPGSRVPICGVHITATVPGYPIPLVWNTRNRSSSGFNLIVHNAGLDYSPTIWIYYIAYWGEPPNSPITTG